MTPESSAPPAEPQRKKPESFRGRTLAASLTVNDIRKSIAWYRDVVGFIVEEEYGEPGDVRAASIKAGTVALLLAQDDGAKGMDRVKGEGCSLQITTAQNIDELAALIKDRGGVLESEPHDAWGARVFRMKDPDGFKLVISSER